MLERLDKLSKAIDEMSVEELNRLFEGVTEEQAKQFAPLERMLMGETVDGWRLAGAKKNELD
jgi:hypothetical protein